MTRAHLEHLCSRARERAASHGAPVVATYVLPADGVDPLARLEAAEGLSRGRLAWERPKDRFALAAGGTAWRFRADGPRRFHDMAEQVETALHAAVVGGPGAGGAPGAPYALGGFAFFDALDDSQWPGFGAGQMVLPEWLTVRRNGRAHTMVNGTLRPGDDPGAVAEALAARLERLEAARPAGDAPAVRPAEGVRRADDVEGHRHWLEMVRVALAKIHGGELEKIVLARAVELYCRQPASPYILLRMLREAYPDCFSFLVDPGAGEWFLGATPERLALLSDGTLRLGAMAGSAPRGERPDADEALGERLLRNPKERHEHRVVVEAIREAVRACPGEVEMPEAPRLVRLTNVQHLYTPITVRLREPLSLLALLARLHPTPAVGGHPRAAALPLIKSQERFDRGWYAGPVGWVDARGEGEFAVALRAGAFRGGQVRLFTGAGIVADSDPETEYFETQLKLQPLLSALVQA